MTDLFDYSTSTGANGARNVGIDEDIAATRAPNFPLVVLASEVVIACVAFVPASKTFHVAGYAIAALAVALTAVWYRTIDRVRRRASDYVDQIWKRHFVACCLVCGILLAAAHAYYLTQSKQLAR